MTDPPLQAENTIDFYACMQTYTYRIRALKGLDNGVEANEQKSAAPSVQPSAMGQWHSSTLPGKGND
eukprot:246982-Chlamydomonas_euryale.AAC.1